jgi:hypothetical protein
MERSIREAVGRDGAGGPAARPWWRRWSSLAPLTAALAAALVLLVVWGRPAQHATAPHPREALDQPVPLPPPSLAPGDDAVALWLDGAVVDVDPRAVDALVVPGTDESEADEGGLLPSTDLAWVDSLDDDALARAERWLAGTEG